MHAQAELQATDPNLLARLRGAPLSVLLALASGPKSREQLVQLTGWSQNSVSGALELLHGLGLAVRPHYRCWALAPGVDIFARLDAAPAPPCDHGTPHEHDAPAAEAPPVVLPPERSPADSSSAEQSANDRSPGQSVRDVSTAERSANDRSPEQSTPDVSASEPSTSDRSAHQQSATDLSPERSSAHFSASEQSTSDRSAHHGVHGVHDVDDDPHKHHKDEYHHQHQHQHHEGEAQISRLARELLALDPPFSNPESWLRHVSLPLVQGWLDYLDSLDRDGRRAIRSQSGFLRAKVSAGAPPPRASGGRRPCPQCGHPYFDADRRCLVCAGVIHR